MIMKHEINVPEGCKVVSVETTDEMVVVKFEKDEPKFKENDIVYTVYNNHPCISIINFFESYSFCSIKTKYSFDVDLNTLDCDPTYAYETIRLATDSEKQLLFDKLKEKCLMFDGKNIVRWRAKPIESYYSIFGSGIISLFKDSYIADSEHERKYNSGNYFPTRELAESFQKQYIDLLNNFHKNLQL